VGNLGRSPFLIIIALVFLLLIVLPLLNRKSGSGLNDSERAQRTQEAIDRVVRAEGEYAKANGNLYTEHIADLIPLTQGKRVTLADDLTDGFAIQLDAGADRKTYFVQVSSTVLILSRTFKNGARVSSSCLSLKNAGDKYCTRDQPKDPLSLPRK
jgi:hypothetical protein